MGIEPTLPAWEAEVLPLNYTRGFPEDVTAIEEYRQAYCLGVL